MADNLKETFRKKIIPVRFERSIGLAGATTIGVGALMGSGIYVLMGLAAREAGAAVWLAFLICGATTYLTTLLYVEITKLAPEGGYTYAFNALGSLGGFTIRWFPALGSIFASALYTASFAEYLLPLLGYSFGHLATKLVGLLLVAVSTLLNVRGTQDAGKVQGTLIWGNLGILAVLVVASLFVADPSSLTPVFEQGAEGVFGAVSIIYISFFGFQLIGSNTEEIRDPVRTVPLAMKLSMAISTVFYLMVALVSVMVMPWQELAASTAPLALVATKGLGQFGFILVALGGVMASAGALNSTLLSQGRQIHALGKKNFLPAFLGKLHQVRKTPVVALYTGGAVVALIVLVFDLEFIAKSANFCLLASLLPVSIALRRVYRQYPEKRPKQRWKRWLPEITFVTNLALLFTLDWVTLSFGAQLVGIGFAIYFFYGQKHERRSSEGLNIVLSQENRKKYWRGLRILVPLSNPLTQAAILRVSGTILNSSGKGEVNLLKVVRVPEQSDFYNSLKEIELDELDILEKATKIPDFEHLRIKPLIRASHFLGRGIVYAAEEEACDIIVMGYSGQKGQTSNSLMEEVIYHTKTDTVILKLRGLSPAKEFSPQKIAVSVGGVSNLPLMLKLAGALADHFKGRITFLHILPETYTAKQRQQSVRTLVEALESQHFQALFDVSVLSSPNALDTLVEQSANFDLLIAGTTTTKLLQRAILGSFATSLAERAVCSVAVVRVVPRAHKLVRSIKN